MTSHPPEYTPPLRPVRVQGQCTCAEMIAAKAEISRLHGIAEWAYAEGVVDAFTRGANVGNIAELWATSDSRSALKEDGE